jgi:hypothetical protein
MTRTSSSWCAVMWRWASRAMAAASSSAPSSCPRSRAAVCVGLIGRGIACYMQNQASGQQSEPVGRPVVRFLRGAPLRRYPLFRCFVDACASQAVTGEIDPPRGLRPARLVLASGRVLAWWREARRSFVITPCRRDVWGLAANLVKRAARAARIHRRFHLGFRCLRAQHDSSTFCCG